MSGFEDLLNTLPDFAKDIKLNAKSLILGESVLNNKQIGIITIACSLTTKNQSLINKIIEHFSSLLSEVELNAAKTAATIMGMTNIYYRFLHLVSDKSYENLPAGLRMNGLASHGIEKIDFELASLAVSAINGCGMCIDSHEKTLKKHNASNEQIQYAIKIAAIINALASI